MIVSPESIDKKYIPASPINILFIILKIKKIIITKIINTKIELKFIFVAINMNIIKNILPDKPLIPSIIFIEF
tara:strand:- start:43 stop:261 length:219 start_codon:yes stop_codon:yes gene_type:complete